MCWLKTGKRPTATCQSKKKNEPKLKKAPWCANPMRGLVALLVLCLLTPSALAEFGEEKAGYPVNIDGEIVFPYIPASWEERHPELVAELLSSGDPMNKVNGYTLFPYYPLLTAEVQRLAAEHPGLVRLTSAGQSRAGLDLHLLEIADFNNPDRIPLDEREVIYLDGGTHSNEYSGVYFTTEWAQFLLDEFETDATAKWIVENRHVFILPMVNPDGSHAFGRVNAIDVNINRNFPATWGTVEELPVLNWPGPWPASEPETQAVINVLQTTSPDFVQSTHCCGNLWLHPYGAEQLGHAPDFDMYSNICINVFPDLTLDVEKSQCGETWSTIYPAAGTTLDEGYAQVGASSWSYEMSGRGAVAGWGQPVVDTDVRQQEIESWRGVMHGMLHAEKYGAWPVVTHIEGSEDALLVTVENQGWGNLTRGTVEIAGREFALNGLPFGGATQITVAGSFDEGTIPLELEWKKRVHPDSNWGRTTFTAQLVADGDALVGILPEPVEVPDMGDLLPPSPEDAAVLDSENVEPLDHGADDNHDSPGFVLPLALIGLLGLALRRRS